MSDKEKLAVLLFPIRLPLLFAGIIGWTLFLIAFAFPMLILRELFIDV